MTGKSRSPFPTNLPASITEPAAIRENDWAAFRSLDSVESHWELRKWKPGQAGFYWYLTIEESELISLSRKCQTGLESSKLDLVPENGLHITMFGIGDVEQLYDADLANLISHARKALKAFKPFEIEVGPLSGSQSAIRFSVAPWDSLTNLYRILRHCTALVWPDRRIVHESDFRPHLGIAYINERQDSRVLIDKVAELRNLPPVKVRIDTVRLVRLWRTDHQYRWQVREEIPFHN